MTGWTGEPGYAGPIATYDVVTLEPMPPNFAGVNALYSREFYVLVASARLGVPAGVVAQWLPFRTQRREVERSFATFRGGSSGTRFRGRSRGLLAKRILVGRQGTTERIPFLASCWPGLRAPRADAAT